MSNMRHRRISAILPTFNRADILEETLDSILSQVEPPEEVIVVDDGSTDNTRTVLDRFSAHIRTVHIRNSGAPVARNTGAYLATGEWFWFCDSDDLWRPEYLAHVRALLNTDAEPGFVFGNFQLIRNGAWDTRTKFEDAPAGYWGRSQGAEIGGHWIVAEPLYEKLLEFQPVFHSTLVVSRALFDAVGGYNPRFARTGSEDFEFILRCGSHGPCGVVGDALVGIRRHENNFSANQLRNLLGEIEILRYARTRHDAAQKVLPAIDRQIALRSLQSLELAFTTGNYPLVRSLTPSAKKAKVGFRPQVKMLLAGMPSILRDPVVTLTTRRAQ